MRPSPNVCLHGEWHRLAPLVERSAYADNIISQHCGSSVCQRSHTIRVTNVPRIAHTLRAARPWPRNYDVCPDRVALGARGPEVACPWPRISRCVQPPREVYPRCVQPSVVLAWACAHPGKRARGYKRASRGARLGEFAPRRHARLDPGMCTRPGARPGLGAWEVPDDRAPIPRRTRAQLPGMRCAHNALRALHALHFLCGIGYNNLRDRFYV